MLGDQAGGEEMVQEQPGGTVKAVRWDDTKRQVRELNPDWDTPERVASRERSRAEMRAEQRGHQLRAALRENPADAGFADDPERGHNDLAPHPIVTAAPSTKIVRQFWLLE
jgi:hypothetical protein